MEQMVNFLNPMFKTNIKCSAVLDDFYLPENLISSDRRKFELGFMAYSVQKPPVELEFELMCLIDLHSIRLWPKLDSLKSTAFEVYVSDGAESVNKFVKIGNCFNLIENGVIFDRNLNKHRANADATVSNDHNFRTIPFYRSVSYRTLSHVKRVKICITQTARCTPVLKRIEIWGRISRDEADNRRQSVLQILTLQQTVSDSVKKCCDESLDKVNDLNGIEVPEEFLDAITFEIMALPMVLPSGKIIDMSTLNKHNQAEEKWGRAPSDPYTGQSFSATRKPVLNTALKSQIDKFLLENGHIPELSTIPRTVGARDLQKRKNSELVLNSASPTNIHKKPKTTSQNVNHSIYLSTGPHSSQTSINIPSDTTSVHLPSTSASLLTTQRKSMSLDERVQMALKSITRYTKSSVNQQPIDKCFQCENENEINFYKIKLCSHIICRNCLISKNLNVCKCGSKFDNAHLERYHKKMLL